MSSAILSNTKLESSRIQSKCCSIQYRFISSIVCPCYEISIDISLIRSNRPVWESAGYRKSPFGRNIRWRSRWVSPQCRHCLSQCCNIVNLTSRKKTLIETQTFSLKKIHFNMSSVKLQPFCLGLNVLNAQCTLLAPSACPLSVFSAVIVLTG